MSDLVGYRDTVLNFARETGLIFSENEIDGMTSLLYNGNHTHDPDSLLYYFLRKDKDGAINIIRKANENGWYGDHPGLLRRRLMEFNIFFNNNYSFYSDKELEELKEEVGF